MLSAWPNAPAERHGHDRVDDADRPRPPLRHVDAAEHADPGWREQCGRKCGAQPGAHPHSYYQANLMGDALAERHQRAPGVQRRALKASHARHGHAKGGSLAAAPVCV